MVEIPVERKSNLTWLWVLLALIVIGLLIWWALDNDDADTAAVVPATAIETNAAPEASLAPGSDSVAATEGPTAGASIAQITSNPAAYVGRDDFSAEVAVPDVPTDRGFWVEDDGVRLFALIIDNPEEKPLDIDPGEQLRVTNGMLRDSSSVGALPGAPLDADTMKILEDQKIFLVVDEADIEILSGPNA